MRTRPLGSVIGAIAGLIFILINAGAVPASLLWRVLGVVGFFAVVWFVVIRGPLVHQPQPSRSALRTYGICVVAEVAAIPLGALFLRNVLERPNAVPVWVVFVVGVHFLPFARAFGLPVFGWLGAALIAIAVVGAIPALVSDSATAAGWTGVAAGFVLVLFSAVGPRLSARTASQQRR